MCGCAAASCAKSGADELTTLNDPSPFDNATGIVAQPGTPVSAMSERLSLLNRPTSLTAVVRWHPGLGGRIS